MPPADHPGSDERWPAGLRPTHDDGHRITGELSWDEAARPRPPIPDQTGWTDTQLARPRHLIEIHDALRAELDRVRDIVDEVASGHLQVSQARSVINTMTMRHHHWALGAYCQSYCRIVTGHHTLEDRSVFTRLGAVQPDLEPVLHRLESEHEVIAEVLEGLDRALVDLVRSDGYGVRGVQALARLRRSVDLLTDTLLSHLAYEERVLFDPLARHGMF